MTAMVAAFSRPGLDTGLSRLRENMTTLSELAEVAIRSAVDGLERSDSDQAGNVFTLDREIYAIKEKIIRSCIPLLALYAPVACDLRTITASMEIAVDLDRIGRYSKDIAEVIPRLNGISPPPTSTSADLNRLGGLTIEMVTTALTSFLHQDPELVRDIVEHDDAIDDLYDQLFQEIVADIANNAIAPRVGANYILVDRYFERLADHAVNIGQHVIYMVTGDRPPTSRPARPAYAIPTASVAPSPQPS